MLGSTELPASSKPRSGHVRGTQRPQRPPRPGRRGGARPGGGVRRDQRRARRLPAAAGRLPAGHDRDPGVPGGAHPRRAVAAGPRGQRLHREPAQGRRPDRGPRPGPPGRRHRRLRRLHRHRAVDRGRRGRLRPRPRRDLRAGQGVLRRPGHGHERDDAVREQGRDRHHEHVRRGERPDRDRRPRRPRLVRARRPAGVRGPPPRARGTAGGLRPGQRDLRAGRAGPAVRRPRQRRGRRRRRLHHRPAARDRRLHSCSTTQSCCSARRTSSWWSARTSWTRSTPTRS